MVLGRNLVGQEPWELRGANEARLRALETRYAVRATSATNTVCASGATTKITLDTINFADRESDFRTATSDYLVPVTALYDIQGRCRFSNPVDGQVLSLNIFVNGSLALSGSRLDVPVFAVSNILTVGDVLELSAGDVVDMRLENLDNGGAASSVTTNSGAPNLPSLTIRRVGP